MSRPDSCFRRRGVAVGLLVGALAAIAPGASAMPLLSEVFYDAVGSDNGATFVEIYAPAGTSLDGLVLDGVNGANGSVGPSLTLSGVVPANGLFVVADDQGDGTSAVAGADLVLNFDFQNGPDSIRLRRGTTILDALGYGVFGAGEVFAGEGSPAADPAAGSSLARRFANVDTDDNSADFLVSDTPTPGSAPLAVLPEPPLAALFGLLGVVLVGRRLAPRP